MHGRPQNPNARCMCCVGYSSLFVSLSVHLNACLSISCILLAYDIYATKIILTPANFYI